MSTQPISIQIRQAIVNCGMTRYKLSQLTGIDQSALSKFVAGKVGLTLANIDELGKALGMQVVPDESRSGKTRRKLAGVLGIKKSAVDRFAAKHGITPAEFDELLIVLGLRTVSETTQAGKPARKRKAKGTR